MPELPEVETMVRGVQPHVAGRKITRMELCDCRCRPLTMQPAFEEFAAKVAGQKVAQVRRRAKRCVLELSNGSAIVIEPRMTGLLLLADPPDAEHLRIAWRLGGAGAYRTLWFWDRRGLGTVRLYDVDQHAALFSTATLGKDALEMTLDDWREVCGRTSRPIKVALLEQKLVAGIGNLYASEILFRARISPLRPAARLTKPQLARLAEATAHILAEAIRYEGSTLGDGTYRNALNKAGGYQNAHQVYQRAGEPCGQCGRGRIARMVQAQRATFWCAVCQKK